MRIDTSSGLGSGIILDAGGDIVTNAHVVGTDTPDTPTLSAALATLKPGQRVPVVVTHDNGSTRTVTVTLGTLAVC